MYWYWSMNRRTWFSLLQLSHLLSLMFGIDQWGVRSSPSPAPWPQCPGDSCRVLVRAKLTLSYICISVTDKTLAWLGHACQSLSLNRVRPTEPLTQPHPPVIKFNLLISIHLCFTSILIYFELPKFNLLIITDKFFLLQVTKHVHRQINM